MSNLSIFKGVIKKYEWFGNSLHLYLITPRGERLTCKTEKTILNNEYIDIKDFIDVLVSQSTLVTIYGIKNSVDNHIIIKNIK